MAGAREGRERADEIAIEPPQVRVAMGAIERRVEARDRTALGVAVVDEATNVGVGAMDLIVAVLDEPRVDVSPIVIWYATPLSRRSWRRPSSGRYVPRIASCTHSSPCGQRPAPRAY